MRTTDRGNSLVHFLLLLLLTIPEVWAEGASDPFLPGPPIQGITHDSDPCGPTVHNLDAKAQMGALLEQLVGGDIDGGYVGVHPGRTLFISRKASDDSALITLDNRTWSYAPGEVDWWALTSSPAPSDEAWPGGDGFPDVMRILQTLAAPICEKCHVEVTEPRPLSEEEMRQVHAP